MSTRLQLDICAITYVSFDNRVELWLNVKPSKHIQRSCVSLHTKIYLPHSFWCLPNSV